MKTEWRIFGIVGSFLVIATVGYAGWTYGEYGEIEWIGSVGLLLSSVLCLMCGGFFWFVSRRIEPRPEDRSDGEIADNAGEVGFFSPGSYWPLGVASAAAVTAMGLSYMLWWVVIAGLAAVVVATAGLIFEYYTGTRRAAER